MVVFAYIYIPDRSESPVYVDVYMSRCVQLPLIKFKWVCIAHAQINCELSDGGVFLGYLLISQVLGDLCINIFD